MNRSRFESGVARRSLAYSIGIFIAFSAIPFVDGGISDTVLTVRVTGESGSAAYTLSIDQAGWRAADPAGEHRWRLDKPVTLINPQSGSTLAELSEIELYVRGDPCLAISFAIIAGSEPVTVEIESGLLGFEPMRCASAFLSAGLTLRDDDGDGASVIGESGPSGDRVVWATYNNDQPPFVTFATAMSGLTLPGGTRVGSIAENEPLEGVTMLPDTVHDMLLTLVFELSARDCVTGSAVFDIQPGSVLTGDLNCDGVIDFDDVDGFVLVLHDEQSYRESYPTCCGNVAGDINHDESVNFEDIDAFVECLYERGC